VFFKLPEVRETEAKCLY